MAQKRPSTPPPRLEVTPPPPLDDNAQASIAHFTQQCRSLEDILALYYDVFEAFRRSLGSLALTTNIDAYIAADAAAVLTSRAYTLITSAHDETQPHRTRATAAKTRQVKPRQLTEIEGMSRKGPWGLSFLQMLGLFRVEGLQSSKFLRALRDVQDEGWEMQEFLSELIRQQQSRVATTEQNMIAQRNKNRGRERPKCWAPRDVDTTRNVLLAAGLRPVWPAKAKKRRNQEVSGRPSKAQLMGQDDGQGKERNAGMRQKYREAGGVDEQEGRQSVLGREDDNWGADGQEGGTRGAAGQEDDIREPTRADAGDSVEYGQTWNGSLENEQATGLPRRTSDTEEHDCGSRLDMEYGRGLHGPNRVDEYGSEFDPIDVDNNMDDDDDDDDNIYDDDDNIYDDDEPPFELRTQEDSNGEDEGVVPHADDISTAAQFTPAQTKTPPASPTAAPRLPLPADAPSMACSPAAAAPAPSATSSATRTWTTATSSSSITNTSIPPDMVARARQPPTSLGADSVRQLLRALLPVKTHVCHEAQFGDIAEGTKRVCLPIETESRWIVALVDWPSDDEQDQTALRILCWLTRSNDADTASCRAVVQRFVNTHLPVHDATPHTLVLRTMEMDLDPADLGSSPHVAVLIAAFTFHSIRSPQVLTSSTAEWVARVFHHIASPDDNELPAVPDGFRPQLPPGYLEDVAPAYVASLKHCLPRIESFRDIAQGFVAILGLVQRGHDAHLGGLEESGRGRGEQEVVQARAATRILKKLLDHATLSSRVCSEEIKFVKDKTTHP